jgi:cell division protein FtsW
MHKAITKPRSRGNDYVIIVLGTLLITFGMAMLSSASSHMSRMQTGGTMYYVIHQLMYGILPGAVLFLILSNIYYKRYERLAAFGMIFAIGLLALTLSPLAFSAKGAARWVKLGPIIFQPSEPLKLFFIMYLAAWLASPKARDRHSHGGFIIFLVILSTILGLLIQQPATSTALLIGTVATLMYIVSGARLSHLLITGAVAVAGLAIVVWISPYRMARINAFLHPEQNARGSGFQVSQARIAIGAGGLLGVGYGQSTTKINSLPEPIGDSIFAVIGEETGFAGSIALLGLILALIVRIFIVAHETRDRFGHLLLIGFGSLIAIQGFVNIGAISGLVPPTGIALPFISYGSSALVVFMGILGIINNISKHND